MTGVVTVERLDEQLTVWAERLKTELALYPDGSRIWNRTKFDMFGRWQQKKLSVQVQELFEQQRHLKNAYSSVGAAEHCERRLRSMSELSDSFVRRILKHRGYEEPPEKQQEDLFPQVHKEAYKTENVAPPTKKGETNKPHSKSVTRESLGREFESAISRIKAALGNEIRGQTAWNYLVGVRFRLQPYQLAKVSLVLQTRIKELQKVEKKYKAHKLGSEYKAKLSQLTIVRRVESGHAVKPTNRSKASPQKNGGGIEGYSGKKDYYSRRRYYWNEE